MILMMFSAAAGEESPKTLDRKRKIPVHCLIQDQTLSYNNKTSKFIPQPLIGYGVQGLGIRYAPERWMNRSLQGHAQRTTLVSVVCDCAEHCV